MEDASKRIDDDGFIVSEFKTRYKDRALEVVKGIVHDYVNDGIPIITGFCMDGKTTRTRKSDVRCNERVAWFEENHPVEQYGIINDCIKYVNWDSRETSKKRKFKGLGGPIKEMMKNYEGAGVDEQIGEYKSIADSFIKINPN